MADALCGPSNPLQNLKNHSQIDRTLQQDRLTGPRHPPAQGFRTPDPRAGSLDAAFAAFEAGPQPSFHLQSQPLVPPRSFAPAQPVLQSDQQNENLPPGWAADFQRLHLGAAPNQALTQNQFLSQAPMVRSGTERGVGGWHDELLHQQQNFLAGNANGHQSARSAMPELSYSRGQPMSHYPLAHRQLGLHEGMQFSTGEEAFQNGHMDVADSAAFEAAFAQAEGAQTLEQGSAQQDLSSRMELAGVRLDPILNPENKPFQTLPDEQPTFRIGSDVIPPPDRTAFKSTEQQMHDADELSRTAGQLLSSVRQETSSKFQQSQFLNLMRRIRDREVVVQGEELLDTTTGENARNHDMNSVPHAQAVFSSSSPQQHDLSVLDEPKHQQSLMMLEVNSRIRMAMARGRPQQAVELRAKYEKMEELWKVRDAESVHEEIKALFKSAAALQQQDSVDRLGLNAEQRTDLIDAQNAIMMARERGQPPKLADQETVKRLDEVMRVHEANKAQEESQALPTSSSVQQQDSPVNSALSDYEFQIQLLNAQNERRRAMAREETARMEESRIREESQALHPGGRRYPYSVHEGAEEQEDRHKYDHWASGGIGAEDERVEESTGLADRFRRVRIEDMEE